MPAVMLAAMLDPVVTRAGKTSLSGVTLPRDAWHPCATISPVLAPLNFRHRIVLVESIPEGMTFSDGSVPNPSTFSTWMNLLGTVTRSLDIASFYWTMTNEDTRTHEPSAAQVCTAGIWHMWHSSDSGA